MIDLETRKAVQELASDYWRERVKTPEFRAMASGKEIGHRIADYVDEHTAAKLFAELDVKHEVDNAGRVLARSMGDLWLKSSGIYNPVNVKAGIVTTGQPNLVSLTKLLDRLLAHQIDSYDLLIVKMSIPGVSDDAGSADEGSTPADIGCAVHFVDMLDFLDHVTFDAGPGQVMLKEREFYPALESGYRPSERGLPEKVTACMDLMEDGIARLLKNREKRMVKLRAEVKAFMDGGAFVVNQSELRLG
ncbi:MAG: hypothetical protein M0T77_11025 [Actinomycetota bacterium]|nr:hypothetical protein [Actinomycetota bacterium]